MPTRPRHVFLTFLGTGAYSEVEYTHGGRALPRTRYAALAELRGPLAHDPPDVVFVVATKTALHAHGELFRKQDFQTKQWLDQGPGLLPQLREVHPDVQPVEMTEALSTDAQWGFFQQLLNHIQPGDAVSIDMTHGFRATPVVLSSALHFLRIARNIELRHVFYAVYDASPPAIVDYREFYAINEWTEAVGRLVDDADASHLAELSRAGGALAMPGLSADRVPEALTRLTAAIRDVDIQHIADTAADALGAVEAARAGANGASALLLGMVLDKFGVLVGQPPASGRYDRPYFSVQLALVRLLLDHGLNMQAFTTLRECVASLGLHVRSGLKSKDLRSVSKARGARMRADAFFATLLTPEFDEHGEPGWKFGGDAATLQQEVLPWYRTLDQAGIIGELRPHANEIKNIRNGFDHAWTTKVYKGQNLKERGTTLVNAVEAALTAIENLPPPAETPPSGP